MKIAYLTNLNAVDGGGVNADRLCRAFHEHADLDLVAVHAQGTAAPENFWTTELDYNALYPTSLRAGLDATDPDIVFVHAYNPEMVEYLADYATEDENADRVYVFRHGVNVLEQWLTLYQYGEPSRVTTPVYNLDFFDAVFAPSNAAAERLKFHYGDACPPLAVAPCTIEYDKYAPTPYLEDETLRIVTASRLAPNNYILAPVLAARRLTDDLEVTVEMEILSAGDPPYRETVMQVAEDIEGVHVVGQLPAGEVRSHLEWADVVCVPSISQQAVPTVAVEAMAAGNVVLAGGFYTTNEEDALIRLPVDHPPAWWDALRDAVEDPEDAQDWLRTGLDHAKQYDVQRVVEEAYLPMFHLLRG